MKSVEAQTRVARSAVEGRIRARREPDHPLFLWLIEYAVVLLSMFEVGKDGMTAYERRKAKKARTLGLEFGEAILWKRRPVS